MKTVDKLETACKYIVIACILILAFTATSCSSQKYSNQSMRYERLCEYN